MQLRLNDADDPDRHDKFITARKKSAANGSAIIRQLVDAYNLYVSEHGRGPTFPVRLISAEKLPPTVKPKSRKARPTRKK